MYSQLRPTGLDWRLERKSDLPVSPVAQQENRTLGLIPLSCGRLCVAQWEELGVFVWRSEF